MMSILMRFCNNCKTYNRVPCGACHRKAEEIMEAHNNCGHKGTSPDDYCGCCAGNFEGMETMCDCVSEANRIREVM